MAKDKGKSDKRIRDWHRRRLVGEEIEDISASRQQVRRKGIKLREDSFAGRTQAQGEPDLAGTTQVEGMVTAVFRRGAYVRLAGRQVFCGLAKTFRAPATSSPLAVGDIVTVALSKAAHTGGRLDIDKDRMDGMMLSRQPRRTVIARPQPRSAKRNDKYDEDLAYDKVIAANMDVMLVVASVREPSLRPRLIERFLIVAERGELKPILAINKIDLQPPDEESLEHLADLGAKIILCSARGGQGMEDLRTALTGKSSVLVGASGVGKSTLINVLVPGAEAATREVRSKDQRGRHTTAAAAVFDLPGGGLIVDTPGVRELGVRLQPTEAAWYFPEFEEFAPQCRFNDCTHTHEPHCAVQAAVEDGRLKPQRYESYLRLLENIEENLM